MRRTRVLCIHHHRRGLWGNMGVVKGEGSHYHRTRPYVLSKESANVRLKMDQRLVVVVKNFTYHHSYAARSGSSTWL
jgi:hypothetical protein